MSPQNPSIWLRHSSLTNISPDKTASFVEYLRWMRLHTDDTAIDNGTKLELFKNFEDNDFSETLNRLTVRTKKIADFSFKVTCPWRIRVGGTKAPESMLLPAFDNIGMPYIPSSTLRGVAREMARQDKNTTDAKVKEIFGDIDSDSTKMGQVVFLDAYPLARTSKEDRKKLGGTTPDMANAIWKWDGNKAPEYGKPNPNSFLSLNKSIFVIGLRRTAKCSDDIFTKVRNWLIKGLAQGIGSRVNSGYGSLRVGKELKQHIVVKPSIIKVQFELQGQLIHGEQTFQDWDTRKKELKVQAKSALEVRPVAFRSMLRYWFRVLALGVLPPNRVRNLELEIFGGIEPDSSTGLFRCEIINAKISDEKVTDQNPPFMLGTLILRKNLLLQRLSEKKQQAVTSLLKELVWLMFHLGGVGQGARRSCYCRGYRYDRGYEQKKNPFWRGSSLIPDTDTFWNLPNSFPEIKELFQLKLQSFYLNLAKIISLTIESQNLLSVNFSRNRDWSEAVDSNCKIFICQGEDRGNKNFALSILHSPAFKVSEVCGRVNPSIPSPVWIRHIDYLEKTDFQVVTIFGAKTGKRKEFVKKLRQDADRCLQIFPIN